MIKLIKSFIDRHDIVFEITYLIFDIIIPWGAIVIFYVLLPILCVVLFWNAIISTF